MSVPGESYEQWLARTAPQQPVRTVDPRTWGRGVIALLGVFFLWVGTSPGGWIGLALVILLVVEEIAQGRMQRAGGAGYSLALRGGTLLVTLTLSGLVIWLEGGVAGFLPVLLVLLDVKDDRSFLRWVLTRVRGRQLRRVRPGR